MNEHDALSSKQYKENWEDALSILKDTEKKLNRLYFSTNKLMARLGAYGEYHPDMDEVSNVMNALYDIDGGIYKPKVDA